MALFRRLFYRKPPDRLLEISERVYVFDCCFSSEILGDKAFKSYLGNIVSQFQDYFPDASFMVCNFREGDKKSLISDILSEYDMPVMDYPWQYEGCPLLPLEMIHHFLKSSESWLSLEGQQNVLLMHCERGGWPVLAFMLSGLLLYRKQYSGEQKTLEMVYKQAPKELLHLFCSLNPQPSHLRYLHYITRQSSESDWPPKDKPFTLECIILRVVPQFDVKGGFRPVVRVHGQDPLTTTNRCPKILISTPISKKVARSYRQESAGLKINARCHVQGDVVLECIHVDEDLEQEEMMFRIMFNTAFVESDILVLNSEDIDVAWNVKDQFPRDFRAEVLLSEFVEAESEMNLEAETGDGDADFDDLEGASIEEFFEAEEIFSNSEVYTETQILRTKNAMVDIVLDSEIHVINDNEEDKLESGVVQQSYSNFTIKRSEPTPIANEAECIFTAIDSEHDVTEKLIMLDGVFPHAERTNLESSLLRKTEAFSSIVEESPVSRSFEDSIPKALNTLVISNIFQKMVTIVGEPNKFCISSPANGRNSKTEYNASLEQLGDSDNTTSIFVSSVTNHVTAQEISFYCGRDHDLTRCDIADQREQELVTNDWHNDIEKKVEVYSDLSLETSLATEHRLRDSSITVCDKRIISEKLIALNEVSGVEEDKLAKNDNFLTQDREDVVPELKERRSTAGPAHSECAAKAVLSQHENGFKNAIEGKLDTHVSFVEEKCLLESANSKNNHETNYKFKDSILGDKSQTIYSRETSIKGLLIAETVDSARENDDSASEVRAEAKFTNKKTGGTRRRQNNEKNLSPILKKSTTRIRPPSNPAIEKQKGSQQEASYLHTSTTKVIIVPRWISPNKASDSPYLYKPSYPPFRYNSAPSALPNSSIQTDDQIISAIDLPVDCVSLDGGATLLGSMPPPPPPPPPPPSFRQPISSRTSIKVTSSLPPPPSQPCPFAPPSSLTFLGSAIKFSCPPLSPPVPPPPHPPTNLSASISASNVPLPSSPKLQISQPVLKKASVPHSQALSTSSMGNSLCTSPHLPPPPPPPPPPPLPHPPNTTKNFLVASPSPPALPSSFGGISNSIPFSISSPFKPSCSPIPHLSIANVGGLITHTPLKVSSNGSLEEPPSSLSSPSLVPKLGVIPLPLLLEPHVETPSAPPPPPRCVPLPPRLPLSGCNITPPTAPLGGNQGAPIPPAIYGGRNSAIPASLHGWHGAPPTPPRAPGAPPTPPRAPGAPPPPRAPGAPPLPPFVSSNTSNGSRSLLTTALVGGRGRGILRPMVSGSTSLAPRRSPLKPLHWVKVTRAVQGSLWADIQKSDDAPSVFEFDEVELESLFSAVIPKLDDSSKSEGRRKSLGSKSDKVHLIELRRANNTEIMLTKIKIPLSDLMSAALSLDDSVLEADQVENLIKFCPTKEEMELLKGYTGDKEKLGKCEQFFLELMKVPRVESKLRVFSFKIQFFQQVSDLKKNLNIINSACEQIRSSVKFKEIMKKILYLGNMLNQGTARGSAIGFRLDSLLKLTDTRATNSKMTLMHYLCKVLASRSPHLLNFHDGLTSLEAASKIQLKSLAEEMQAIIKGLEKVELELNASESDGPVTKNFQRTLKEFIALAGADVQSLSSFYSSVGRNADALALYFGEDPARCPFEQVISTLMNFVVMFRRAHQENHKHAELEKKKALKDAEAEKSHKASNLSNKNQDKSLGDQLQQSLDKAKAANQQGKVVG